jgi:hypothetical protein
MHKILRTVGGELLQRGEHALGFSVLLYANYIRAESNGEGEDYINKYREILNKYGLIEILRWNHDEALKRQKFKHPKFNEESLYNS